MSQNYKMYFEISHGVSHGFGVVHDALSIEEKVLDADDDLEALKKAEAQAQYFAREYLANTNGYKTVEVTLRDNQGNEINQIQLVRKEAEKNPVYDRKNFETALKFLFPNGRLTVKRTWIEDFAEIKKLEAGV